MIYFPINRGVFRWIWLDEGKREVLLVQSGDGDSGPTVTHIPLSGDATRSVPLELGNSLAQSVFSLLPEP